MSGILVHIDKAKREIMAADSLVKLKDLWNRADALRQLGQAAKDPSLVTYATEFKLRCERRLGEMLAATEMHVGGRPVKKPVQPTRQVLTLDEIGVSRDLSSRAQRIASVPEEKFEAVIAEAKEGEKELTRKAVDKLLAGAHVGHNTGEFEWYTPEHILDIARRVLGAIDLDPASHPDAQEVVCAESFFAAKDDGLSQEWHGRVWLNPPYTQPLIGQFCTKLIEEFSAGRTHAAITLTNNATETEWGQLLLCNADSVCFPNGRIRFWSKSKATSAPLQGQMICLFGGNEGLFANEFLSVGAVIPK